MKKPRPSSLLPLVGGAAFLLLGLAMVLWPSVLSAILLPLLGIVLILVGVQGVAHTLVMQKKLPDPGMRMVQALVNLLVGIVFLLKQNVSAAFISILFGLYVLITAAVGMAQAFSARSERRPFVAALLEGVLQLALGLLLLVSPFSEGSLWIRVLGIHFVLAALGILRFMHDLRKNPGPLPDDADSEECDGPPPFPR